MMKLLCLAMALGSVSATSSGSRHLQQVVDCSPADLDSSGDVAVDDLLLLLSRYGRVTDEPVDIDGDGTVTVSDLLILLAEYGKDSVCAEEPTDRGEFSSCHPPPPACYRDLKHSLTCGARV
jgi:hypothetical protein